MKTTLQGREHFALVEHDRLLRLSCEVDKQLCLHKVGLTDTPALFYIFLFFFQYSFCAVLAQLCRQVMWSRLGTYIEQQQTEIERHTVRELMQHSNLLASTGDAETPPANALETSKCCSM